MIAIGTMVRAHGLVHDCFLFSAHGVYCQILLILTLSLTDILQNDSIVLAKYSIFEGQ
jgi:hypothetical protein